MVGRGLSGFVVAIDSTRQRIEFVTQLVIMREKHCCAFESGGEMEPTETCTEAENCARSAIRIMKEGDIIPYPRNFTIWYFYFSGKYPDLSDSLAKFMDDMGYFTEDRNALIFQKFFGFDTLGKAIREVTSGTSVALGKSSEHIKAISSEAKSAHDDIADFCNRLKKTEAAGEVKKLVDKLLARVERLETISREAEYLLAEDFRKVSELHRSIEESQRETMTDALTGMANRKLFDACLRLSIEDRRLSASLCVILIDVDNLAEINEKHGLETGDNILRAISRALSEAIKGRDMAARHGDDEFAILVTRVQLADAAKLARNMRCLVGVGKRATDMSLQDDGKKRVTVSIGVAQYEPGEPLSDFLSRLKQALVLAKSNGRNQVVLAEKTGGETMFTNEDNVIVKPPGKR